MSERRLRKGTVVRYEITSHETWRGDGTVREGRITGFFPEDDPKSFLTGEHYTVVRTDCDPSRVARHDAVWPKEILSVRRRGGWEGCP